MTHSTFLKGSKDVYAKADGWKDFRNIVDDLPIFTLNAEDLSLRQGQNRDLDINFTNSDLVNAVQFDFSMPDGLRIATDEDGEYIVETTDRSKKLGATCEKMADGKLRILLYSTKRATIEPGEGAILKIKITCPKETTPDSYEITFNNIYFSRVDGNTSVNENGQDFTAKLTVTKLSTLRGDADGDFTVNITDVIVIVDYILGRYNDNFIFANADLDKNGIVNITDAMIVVDIILGRTSAQIPPSAKKDDFGLLRMSPDVSGCQIHTNTGFATITGFQMDVVLPEECKLKNASLLDHASYTHEVLTRQLEDNHYRVVVFSAKKATLDTNAPILQLLTEGRGGIINVESILCTEENLSTILSQNLSTVATGISTVHGDGGNESPIYNLTGQRVLKPQKGITITNGRKTLVR